MVTENLMVGDRQQSFSVDACYNLNGLGERWRRTQDHLIHRIKDFDIRDVVIWGAGKNGRMAARLLLDTDIRITSFFDQDPSPPIFGIPVLSEPESVDRDTFVIVAMNGSRSKVAEIRDRCDSQHIPHIHLTDIHSESESRLLTESNSLADFADKHRGQRCFVAGNGPSLNAIDMTKLKDEIVFGSNRCYLGFEQWGFEFPYWSVVDNAVGGWQADEWRSLHGFTKFIPSDQLYHIQGHDPDVCPFEIQRINYEDRHPLFSVYPEMLYDGRTVTYVLLQLAVIMGCSPIYLIGVDFHFKKAGTRENDDSEIWHQVEKDINHFHPDYIPVGRYLHDPKYELQKLAFESTRHAGRIYDFDVYNATPGSRLDVFDRIEFDDLF